MIENNKILPDTQIHSALRIFTWVILLHTLLFILFWMTNRPYQRDVNAFLAHALGQEMNYIAIFLGFSLLVLLGSLSILGLASQTTITAPPLYTGMYTLLAVVYLVFFYASFAALFRQDPTQLNRLFQLMHYFRIFPDTLLLLGLAWLAGRFALPLLANRLTQFTAQLVIFAFLAVIWFIPVLYQPGNVYIGWLPSRPALIAHRGAAWLAPENTRSALLRAVELGAYGLETDVTISLDGVPFLMHDATLERTTNVATVFPQRATDLAATFTWNELQQLNAGRWFTDQDPFHSISAGLTPASFVKDYAQDAIPSLQTALTIAKLGGKIILYDLYDPPQGHPYHGLALQSSLETLNKAQLGERAWVLATPAEIAQVRAILPKATLVAGISANDPPLASELLAQDYRVVNSEYPLNDRAIQAYRQAGLWVNLWTVDETWQYSRLWLLDADSVTSNNIYTLKALTQPVLALSYPVYLVVWAVVGLLAAFTLYSSGVEPALLSW